jgi:hypothetical protein
MKTETETKTREQLMAAAAVLQGQTAQLRERLNISRVEFEKFGFRAQDVRYPEKGSHVEAILLALATAREAKVSEELEGIKQLRDLAEKWLRWREEWNAAGGDLNG